MTDIMLDDWFIERMKKHADEIREKMKDAMIYGVKLDDFMLEHPDIALVYAYWVGSLQTTQEWERQIKELADG